MDNIQATCLAASSECCWKEKIVEKSTINREIEHSGIVEINGTFELDNGATLEFNSN